MPLLWNKLMSELPGHSRELCQIHLVLGRAKNQLTRWAPTSRFPTRFRLLNTGSVRAAEMRLTFKRECTDHLIALNAEHLRRREICRL
jgi:hypothetical protein